MTEEPSLVIITTKDLYVELRKLQDQVGTMTPQGRELADHENRLRGLERWRYALPGSLLLAVGALATAIIERGH